MWIIGGPMVSEPLKKSIVESQVPVVMTPGVLRWDFHPGTRFLGMDQARDLVLRGDRPGVYTNSESTLEEFCRWAGEDRAEAIGVFKDKARFRELLRPLYPDFRFQRLSWEELSGSPGPEVPYPVILKPAVGFFSLGVRKVGCASDWGPAVRSLLAESGRWNHVYPGSVLDPRMFLVEQVIEGEEYAFDAYYDSRGEPVIVGIFHHWFGSETDVSDRVYVTSRAILLANLEDFTRLAAQIGTLAGLRNFPVHIEVRRDRGVLVPIEVNPMRFGGWCTTADLTCRALGFNPYLAFFRQTRPDWEALFSGKEALTYGLVVLDNSTGIPDEKLPGFDYERLCSEFRKPLEVRRVDARTHGLFGFLMVETREDDPSELRRILASDLRDYLVEGS